MSKQRSASPSRSDLIAGTEEMPHGRDPVAKTLRMSAQPGTGRSPPSRPRAGRRDRPAGATAIASGSSGNANGSRSSIPSCAENKSRRSATLRPSGPSTEIGVQPSGAAVHRHDAGRGSEAHDATNCGRYPQRSPGIGAGTYRQHVAGERDRGTARGAAGIEPRIRSRSRPNRLRVFAPAPNSGTLVLRHDGARLAHERDHGGVWSGTSCDRAASRRSSEPAVSCRSLIPVGNPCSGQRSPLRASVSALTPICATCESVAAIALTDGLSASMRPIDASRARPAKFPWSRPPPQLEPPQGQQRICLVSWPRQIPLHRHHAASAGSRARAGRA